MARLIYKVGGASKDADERLTEHNSPNDNTEENDQQCCLMHRSLEESPLFKVTLFSQSSL